MHSFLVGEYLPMGPLDTPGQRLRNNGRVQSLVQRCDFTHVAAEERESHVAFYILRLDFVILSTATSKSLFIHFYSAIESVFSGA